MLAGSTGAIELKSQSHFDARAPTHTHRHESANAPTGAHSHCDAAPRSDEPLNPYANSYPDSPSDPSFLSDRNAHTATRFKR